VQERIPKNLAKQVCDIFSKKTSFVKKFEDCREQRYHLRLTK
jgi:hypothetical protein